MGCDSVDNGEIRYGGTTKYSEWSTGKLKWNGLGAINIAADTIYTIEDLTISDVNKSDVTWAALYTNISIVADKIQFNDFYFSGYTTNQKTNTAMHELGHALGLNHSYSGNIVYKYVTSQTTFGSQDLIDYNYLWK